MTAPESLPAVPRRRIPARRLRAFVPLIIGGLCWLAGVPGGPFLLAVGVLGGVAVWREDAASPLDAWIGRFPGVPLRLVERFPVAESRVRSLEAVCVEVGGAATALDEALSASKGPQRRSLNPVRRELAGLVALAADLCCQLERLDLSPDAGPRIERVEATLAGVVPAVRRLHASLVRAGAPGISAHQPRLGSLLTLERELTARQDCMDELEALT
jgi:hypothetical protein